MLRRVRMVLDPRKRQKKLERKAAKRKLQLKAIAERNPTDLGQRFQNAAAAPVVHSQASNAVWSEGIGYVLLSRQIQSNRLAFSVFLVDIYCLGVKNAMSGIRTGGEIETMAEKL